MDESKLTELCEIDEGGFLVESRFCQTGIYFNSLLLAEKKVSLDTWHRRLAHIAPKNVKLTKNIVNGINFNDYPKLKNPSCEACEVGAPIERKRKEVRSKVGDALARIHVDTFQLLPKSYNDHKYGMILTDEATSEKWGYTFKTKNMAFICLQEF